MRSVGIDIGSRATKLVLLEDGEVARTRIADTTFNPLEVCRRLLDGIASERVVATGYGRHLFGALRRSRVITEIKAVALGARELFPACRTVIDIGGQDTKVIALDEVGRLVKFTMNDRCAAGTGRFLEVMATALSYSPGEFMAAALAAERAEKLSTMCTVFAESEVISLVARGVPRAEIALGIHRAIASRTISLVKGVPLVGEVVFTGGGARNACLQRELTTGLGEEIRVPDEPQLTAALGCALHGEREGGEV